MPCTSSTASTHRDHFRATISFLQENRIFHSVRFGSILLPAPKPRFQDHGKSVCSTRRKCLHTCLSVPSLSHLHQPRRCIQVTKFFIHVRIKQDSIAPRSGPVYLTFGRVLATFVHELRGSGSIPPTDGSPGTITWFGVCPAPTAWSRICGSDPFGLFYMKRYIVQLTSFTFQLLQCRDARCLSFVFIAYASSITFVITGGQSETSWILPVTGSTPGKDLTSFGLRVTGLGKAWLRSYTQFDKKRLSFWTLCFRLLVLG